MMFWIGNFVSLHNVKIDGGSKNLCAEESINHVLPDFLEFLSRLVATLRETNGAHLFTATESDPLSFIKQHLMNLFLSFLNCFVFITSLVKFELLLHHIGGQ